ncbi:MAG: NAD-dependent DNA ligase LigA [Desulfococcaceae bacterium]|jgi:DNA ligase (NAD+)|nr:NAD-dependent DNA ligase LigA [Desulfococcaceae bacterium]
MRFFSILFHCIVIAVLITSLFSSVFPGFCADSPPNEHPAESRIRELSAEITRHNYLYYVLGKPEITNEEYDALFAELLRLEQEYPQWILPDSPAQRVGAVPKGGFPRAAHPLPMRSLKKCHSAGEVRSWMAQIREKAGKNTGFVAEEKIDGSALELVYEKGKLLRAVTRGDGNAGLDVSRNARKIVNIPHILSKPLSVVVRGEIFIRVPDFRRIRKEGDTEYSSPRNMAAGMLRKKTYPQDAKMPLDIFVFEAVRGIPEEIRTHWEVLEWLKDLGFAVNPLNRIIRNPEEADDYIRQAESRRKVADISSDYQGDDQGDYPTDGLVFKVNDLHIRQLLGSTSAYPRWAIAYKFEAPEAISIVEGIDVRIGRLGRASPVARFRPVRILGAQITQALLHHQENIQKLGLSVGDTVRVSRRGDVIPAITEVLHRKNSEKCWQMPVHCPFCRSILKKGGAYQICPNRNCPEQVQARLHYFARIMGIRHMGPETVRALMEQGILRNPEDFYAVQKKNLEKIRGFGTDRADTFSASLTESRKRSFSTVIKALGIPGLETRNIRILTEAGYDSVRKIRETTPETLAAIRGIGIKTAEKILKGFHPALRETIRALQAEGLDL